LLGRDKSDVGFGGIAEGAAADSAGDVVGDTGQVGDAALQAGGFGRRRTGGKLDLPRCGL
jgi:hypothetical protein